MFLKPGSRTCCYCNGCSQQYGTHCLYAGPKLRPSKYSHPQNPADNHLSPWYFADEKLLEHSSGHFIQINYMDGKNP